MQTLWKQRQSEGELLWLPVEEIRPNPGQPRRSFEQADLEELADSIRKYGVLQPLTVRRRRGGYELIAGERRLRSAKMAGLRQVPCILAEANAEESSVLALVENLQRRELHFLEEAEGISRLVRVYGMRQEEAASRLGKSPSAVANKLRLMRLPEDVLETIVSAGLTERHARALLRLNTPQEQRQALGKIVELGMNVAAAEAFVDVVLDGSPCPAVKEKAVSRGQKSFVMKDLRLFYNTLDRSLDMLRQGGIPAEVSRKETSEGVTLTVFLPKQGEKPD